MPSLPPAIAEERLALARVGRLATVTPAGRPHVVPVCFALAGGRIVTAVDAKPKATTRARAAGERARDRPREPAGRPLRGGLVASCGGCASTARAEVLESEAAIDALVAKYEQYRATRPAGPVIAIAPERWRSWIPSQSVSTRSRANPGGMDVLKVLGPETLPFRSRKPRWFKVPPPGGERYRELDRMIRDEGLHTVCQEAACPNVGDCWERGTATFMILGDTCTRRCGFCNVKTGKPTFNDPLEPLRVARSVAKMGLRHAVVTSVDRDDLPDYGAQAWVGVIRSIRMQAPWCKIECLTPDFRGEEMPLAKVIAERPDVFNHNVEVAPRLYPVARRGSRWERSLRVLRNAMEMGGGEVTTKSGLMVGLGETHEEMVDAFGQLREQGVQVLTVGQYLRPTERHLPVVRYWEPEEFTALEARRLRARLRARRRRAARALLLPRRRARQAGAPGRRARSPRRAECSRSGTTSRPSTSRSSRSC